MPGISVIIPCHNHGHYLPMAVQSVLAQTFADWEAIVVDDGSTDDTRTVVGQFHDPRIHYIFQDNQGLSAARNAGIRAAQGRYLAFLDADDEWEPRFLEVCLTTLAGHETAAAVVTLNSYIDEEGNVLPRQGGQVLGSEGFRSRLIEGGFFPVHAVLLRAEAIQRAGLFDETLTSVEDWDLWLRITESGGVMLSIPEPLARYRIATVSMSTDAGRMHANRVAVLAKHFGPPEGNPATWPAEKLKGYAFAFRTAALGFIAQQQADEGWRHLLRAVEIDPTLLERPDTFYELALGAQPRGYRGDATRVNIAANGAEMLRRMDLLFASANPSVKAFEGAAYGNAYLALAMLSDQAGDWIAARGYLLRAIRRYPPFLRDKSVTRRLLKLSLGQRVVDNMRHILLKTAYYGAG